MTGATLPNRRQSIRETLREVAIITIGILIALALDGVVDWRREERLVRETRTSLRDEIRDNAKDLSGMVAALPSTRSQLEQILNILGRVLQYRENKQGTAPDTSSLSKPFGIFTIDLSSTARATAETRGALGHMSYAEVQRYSTVYGLQQEFMRLHARMYDSFIQMDSVRQISTDQLSRSELETWRQNLLITLGYLRALESMGKTLLPVYGGIVGER
jgi:hypothetical protein